MTITLELSAEEHAALETVAGAAGVSVEAVLHGVIARLSAQTNAEAPEALGEDPEAEAERRREQKEVEANIKRWHAERS